MPLNLKEKKVIVFDLDGTLAESKQPLDKEMVSLLTSLLEIQYVAVISGGSFEQFLKQFVTPLTTPHAHLEHLLLLPTTSASFYHYENRTWQMVYTETIPLADGERIIHALESASTLFHFALDTEFGPTIENRGSQITLSPLGQHAPIHFKKKWDPAQEKRKEIVSYLKPLLPEFLITIGGMTSIDVTPKGIDKAYGIRKIKEYTHLELEDILFVGDALYEGGNDAPALTAGVDCFSVATVTQTKDLIRSIIA